MGCGYKPYRSDLAWFTTLESSRIRPFTTTYLPLLWTVTSGGGGANTKVPDMYGVGGGCFRDPKHKSNMYTFVQQRGGFHILSRITKV